MRGPVWIDARKLEACGSCGGGMLGRGYVCTRCGRTGLPIEGALLIPDRWGWDADRPAGIDPQWLKRASFVLEPGGRVVEVVPLRACECGLKFVSDTPTGRCGACNIVNDSRFR